MELDFLKSFYVSIHDGEKLNVYQVREFLARKRLDINELKDKSLYSVSGVISLYVWNRFLPYEPIQSNGIYNENCKILDELYLSYKNIQLKNFEKDCIGEEKRNISYNLQSELTDRVSEVSNLDVQKITQKYVDASLLNPKKSMFRYAIKNPISFIDEILPTLFNKHVKLIEKYNELSISDKIKFQNQIELCFVLEIRGILTLINNLSNQIFEAIKNERV